MKVKSESEVAQLCPTLRDPLDCSPPGSAIHGILQARVLEWGTIMTQLGELRENTGHPREERDLCSQAILNSVQSQTVAMCPAVATKTGQSSKSAAGIICDCCL